MPKPTVSVFQYPRTREEMPRGPYAKAGVLVEANAGWRVFRPVIQTARCRKCQQCWLLCPDGAIDRTGECYTVDYNFCKGCGLCATECPAKAIAMVKEGAKGE
ncbi:4Fe-4S binding protein [Anaeroselena agilis]|uniref:4Fe-4S binding protein n=1 Tax=Anaeroselena agilis TaxID=3063788 RepID=A0ABU3P3M2_9FIRM|nr:4Fe-4S binding protein [Selenomonadales bacterium 4137-cl]